MAITIIAAIVSICATGLTYYFSGLYQDISYLWFPFALAIGYFIAFLVLDLIIVILIAQFYSLKKQVKKPSAFYLFQMVNASQVVLFFSRVRVHIKGKELLPKNDKKNRFVLVFNHTSNYDHLCMMHALHNYKIASISKPELEQIPVVGKVQHAGGFIPIDRENAFNALRAIRQATNYIKNGYANIAVNPEGTRSKSGELGEFHPLTFSIAINAKSPLVVAVIKNANMIKSNTPKRRTDVEIEILKVFYPNDYENINYRELSDISHDLIKKSLGQ
jgi:1-acyl-sn-glycerol-3-phosphate acyltransferase